MRLSGCVAAGLFVAEGVHGVEAGCLDGRVHAEEETDATGHAHSHYHRPERNEAGQAGDGGADEGADADADQDADNAALEPYGNTRPDAW